MSRLIKKRSWAAAGLRVVPGGWSEIPGGRGAENRPAPAPGAPPEEREPGESEAWKAARAARQLLATARQRAAEIREAARASGYEEGRKAGLLQGMREAKNTLERARALLDDVAKERERAFLELGPEMVRLSLEVASKIVQRQVGLDPEVAFFNVLTALERVRDEEHVAIRVNPGDAPLVRERKRELEALAQEVKRLSIEEDPGVTPGGCVLETSRGTVDARLESQLAAVEKAVMEVTSGGD